MLDGLNHASRPVLALPRYAKRIIVLLVDVSLCVLTVWLAFYLRLGEFVSLSGNAFWAVAISVTLALPIFMVSGLYRTIFRYAGYPAIFAVIRAIGVYGLLYASILRRWVTGIPRSGADPAAVAVFGHWCFTRLRAIGLEEFIKAVTSCCPTQGASLWCWQRGEQLFPLTIVLRCA